MRKKSLKDKLHDLVKEKQSLGYGEMCQYVAEEGYKVSTAERRLRELMAESTPYISAVHKKSKRRTDYISDYYWIGSEPQTKVIGYVTAYDDQGRPFQKEITEKLW